MPSALTKSSYDDILKDADEAMTWLQGHGFDIGVTRFNKYKNDFKLLADSFKSGTVHENITRSGKFPDIVNASFELHEMIAIWKGLKNITDPNLPERLQKFIAGPFAATQERVEKSSNTPRDIGFELLMGASFASAGFAVDFDPDGDLSYSYNGSPNFVECKRPSSEKKVLKNISKAFSQLEGRYKRSGGADARGIVAISITKFLNPEQRLLVVKTKEELRDKIDGVVERFIRANEHHWQSGFGEKTLGVLASFQASAVVEGENHLLTNCHYIGANNTVAGGPSARELFVEMMQKFIAFTAS
jgi:hypothetical protein